MRQDDWLPTNEKRSARFLPGGSSVTPFDATCENDANQAGSSTMTIGEGPSIVRLRSCLFTAPLYTYTVISLPEEVRSRGHKPCH